MSDLLYLMSFKNPPEPGPYYYDPDNLHVTILDNFSIPNKRFHDFMRTANMLTRWFKAIPLRADGFDLFGVQGDIPVLKVHGGLQLASLHESFADLVMAHDGVLRNPQFAYNGYSSHVSYQRINESAPSFRSVVNRCH